VIDRNAMLAKAQYCAERAENSVHHEMREHWRHASNAWFYAARVIPRASRIIDEWDLKTRQVSLTPLE
jgi:hypothetical protein